jgi:hypothetical protein
LISFFINSHLVTSLVFSYACAFSF